MQTIIINFVLFQLGWFACVLGGANGMPWLGPIAVVGIVLFHLLQASRPKSELKLILLAVLLGTAWDSLLVLNGLLNYSSGMLLSFLAPYWIIAMWALFSTTLNVSLNWMKGRMVLSALFGAIGGPLAYFVGYKMGAVELSDQLAALMALGFGWAIKMPVLMRFAEHFNGFVVLKEVTR